MDNKELEDLKAEDIAPIPQDGAKELTEQERAMLKTACVIVAKLPGTAEQDMWTWLALAEKIKGV